MTSRRRTERNLGAEHLASKQVNARKQSDRALHRTAQRANNHPCVKPVALMFHLCRLIGKPGDVILDPFMGSGTTGMAALWNDQNFIGIERDRGFHRIAKARIEYALNNAMPAFPLRAAGRRKLALTEKTRNTARTWQTTGTNLKRLGASENTRTPRRGPHLEEAGERPAPSHGRQGCSQGLRPSARRSGLAA